MRRKRRRGQKEASLRISFLFQCLRTKKCVVRVSEGSENGEDTAVRRQKIVRSSSKIFGLYSRTRGLFVTHYDSTQKRGLRSISTIFLLAGFLRHVLIVVPPMYLP